MSNILQAKAKRGAPLAGPGLGGQPVDALDLVVVGLGDGRVRLVAARRAVALVLEVDPGRGLQCRLQVRRPHQRRRPPDGVNPADFLGNLDPTLAAHLLLEQCPGEDPRQLGRARPAAWSPGSKGGGTGFGRSACRLYQAVGRSFSLSKMRLELIGYSLDWQRDKGIDGRSLTSIIDRSSRCSSQTCFARTGTSASSADQQIDLERRRPPPVSA